ncbi:unnamed protein product [Durusdinium trenchii]
MIYDLDTGFQVFVNADRRELSNVPGSEPSVRYSTLLVELGPSIARYREIINYLKNGVYPAFLLAYLRV